MNRTKILIVEDEVITSTLVTRALEAQGYQVFSATNGGQAMQSFRTLQPDLMIVDLGLIDEDPFSSAWDGFGILSWLNCNTPDDRPVPVIIHTASDSPAHVTRAKARGAFALVQKSRPPFAELLKTVQAALDASGLPRAAGE